jgi:hypothetical protein
VNEDPVDWGVGTFIFVVRFLVVDVLVGDAIWDGGERRREHCLVGTWLAAVVRSPRVLGQVGPAEA